jgi:anti-sigma factor RsiW
MLNAMIDDDTLDRQLREAAPYIDDDGFTARVMARLPRARREPRWLRAMILVGLAILGSGVAYLLSGGARFVREGMLQLADFPIWLLLVFAFGCGLVVGAFAVIFAIRKTPEARDLTQLRF